MLQFQVTRSTRVLGARANNFLEFFSYCERPSKSKERVRFQSKRRATKGLALLPNLYAALSVFATPRSVKSMCPRGKKKEKRHTNINDRR